MYYRQQFKFFSILALHFVFSSLMAQEADTILVLPEFEIVDSRLNPNTSGLHVLSIDHTTLENNQSLNLPDLLQSQFPLFIKSYGIGSLATPSFRGSSAGHTAIFWNGINLQSSMNGQFDLSLSPVFIADQIQVQLGGSGGIFGSGAVGGSIHLTSLPAYNSGLKFSILNSAGSYRQFFNGFKISKGHKNQYTRMQFLHSGAQNNFEFINMAKAGQPREQLQHANNRQYAATIDHYVLFSHQLQFETHIWWQNMWRQIPPTMTTLESKADQYDNNLRAVIALKKHKKTVHSELSIAYFKENIHFTDSLAGIDADNLAHNISSTVKHYKELNKMFSYEIVLNELFSLAHVSDYSQHPKQLLSGLSPVIYFKSLNNKWNSSFSIRQEIRNKEVFRPVPQLSIRHQINTYWLLKTNLAGVYRYPTFNDMYWNPGGNPSLKPEHGASYDLGINFETKKHLQASVLIFSNYLNDHIIWLPGNSGFWSPENVRSTWSRGIESTLKIKFKTAQIKQQFSAAYSYTKATTTKANNSSLAVIGKQLMYVPEHLINAGISARSEKFQARVNYQFGSKRFTSADNSTYLKAYQIINFSGSYSIDLKKLSFRTGFRINNILNANYQMIAWRPMPGRSYLIDLNILINYQNSNNEK